MKEAGPSLAYLLAIGVAIILSRNLGFGLGKKAGDVSYLVLFFFLLIILTTVASLLAGAIGAEIAYLNLINSLVESTGISKESLEQRVPNNSAGPALFSAVYGAIIGITYGGWRLLKGYRFVEPIRPNVEHSTEVEEE